MRFPIRLTAVLAALVVVAFLATAGETSLTAPRQLRVKLDPNTVAQQVSLANLKQIGIAIHSYHDKAERLPPAAICDKTGKPILSWRVTILPYLEQEALFKQFKLDEAWDGPTNKKLLAKMPAVYAIPGCHDTLATETHYRVFVGKEAGWDWLTGLPFARFSDGTSNTMAVVTAADAVPWTKPDELEFDPKKDMTRHLGLVAGNRWQALWFDGSARQWKKKPDKDVFHAMVTCAGGEVIAFEDE